MRLDICKVVFLTELGFGANFYELIKNGLLILHSCFHSFFDLLVYIAGKGFCQEGFNFHNGNSNRDAIYVFFVVTGES